MRLLKSPDHYKTANLIFYRTQVNFNDCRIPETEFESLSSSLQGSSDLKSLGINDNPLASKAMKLFSILATKPEFDELSMAR